LWCIFDFGNVYIYFSEVNSGRISNSDSMLRIKLKIRLWFLHLWPWQNNLQSFQQLFSLTLKRVHVRNQIIQEFFFAKPNARFGKPSSINQMPHKIPRKLFLREGCVSFAVQKTVCEVKFLAVEMTPVVL
jgi:hypothetical protein